MRIKTYAKGGYIDGGFTSGGGTMTGPLFLAGNPVKDLEAAPKQYADAKLTAFDAERFTSGTLQVGRLPAFTGDVVSNTGSNSILLANIGISSGVYSKVTVNAKGLVTAGGGLAESDIPSLDWSKFSVGRPNSISGYGITDALTKAGGTVSGSLTLSGDPTATFHAATKQYIDNTVGAASALRSGDIVTKMQSSTPTGFLRCNGGTASKTTYAALYAVVGDTFSIADTQQGNGKPWQLQYHFNTALKTDLGPWTYGSNLPLVMPYTQAIVTRNRVYLLGGYDTMSGNGTQLDILSNIFYADIDINGYLVNWINAGNLPIGLYQSQAIVVKNKLYMIGGSVATAQGGTQQSSAVYVTTINTDGTLGTWTTSGSLPVAVGAGSAIITSNRIYLIGGLANGGASNAVYTAVINEDGTLGTWSNANVNLPKTLSAPTTFIVRNRLYVMGGHTGMTSSDSIYYAVIANDGTISSWTAAGTLPVPGYWLQPVVSKDKLFLVAGTQDNGVAVSPYIASILADGSIASWAANTAPAASSYAAGVIVTSSRLYILGAGNSPYVQWSAYSGGLNDYYNYYNGTITPITATTFGLPDLTKFDLPGTYSYIKT